VGLQRGQRRWCLHGRPDQCGQWCGSCVP
jgi:hypothetical protein